MSPTQASPAAGVTAAEIVLHVNGTEHRLHADVRTTLLDALRRLKAVTILQVYQGETS